MPPPLALPKLILQELTPNTCPCFSPGCGFTSLGTAEMRISTSNPEAQQQRGCPCRGQGSAIPADPMGQENSLSLDRPRSSPQGRKCQPTVGAKPEPHKNPPLEGMPEQESHSLKTGPVLISGNLMGKAQSSCPFHSQGAVAAPPVSAAEFLSSQLEQRAHIYLAHVPSQQDQQLLELLALPSG